MMQYKETIPIYCNNHITCINTLYCTFNVVPPRHNELCACENTNTTDSSRALEKLNRCTLYSQNICMCILGQIDRPSQHSHPPPPPKKNTKYTSNNMDNHEISSIHDSQDSFGSQICDYLFHGGSCLIETLVPVPAYLPTRSRTKMDNRFCKMCCNIPHAEAVIFLFQTTGRRFHGEVRYRQAATRAL